MPVVRYHFCSPHVIMMSFKKFLLLAFVFVSTKGEALFNPCLKDDVQCVGTATQSFLFKTYRGHTELGIKPIDPLIIPSVDVTVDEHIGLVFHFKNVNITGLKNLQIQDFKLDTEKNLGRMKMQVDISMQGDADIELTKAQKSFEGPYSASATIIGTSEYGAVLTTIGEKEYFILGPETTSCEIVGDPIVSLGAALQNKIDNDEDAVALKPEYEAKKVTLRKKFLCAVMDYGFSTIIHNLRSVSKAFDKSAFFKDI